MEIPANATSSIVSTSYSQFYRHVVLDGDTILQIQKGKYQPTIFLHMLFLETV